MGFTIILKEETLRDALQLGDDLDTTFLPREMLEETLKDMGYRTPNVSSVSFSKKIGHFNELSCKMMEVVHAVVQEKLYNSSKFLMRNLESNLHT
ncbi:hypothetical protein Hanom_Chr05g00442601 [Helianthus anomalus]